MAKFGKLEQISSRLRALVPTSNIALSGGKISGDVSHINHVICRLGSALREVLHGITTFNALRPTPSISSSFTEQIQVHCALTNVLREQLTVVMKKINLTSFAVVLNGVSVHHLEPRAVILNPLCLSRRTHTHFGSRSALFPDCCRSPTMVNE